MSFMRKDVGSYPGNSYVYTCSVRIHAVCVLRLLAAHVDATVYVYLHGTSAIANARIRY